MPIYVARIERNGKLLLDRADVTIELLDEGHWRGRFILPPETALARGAKLSLTLYDGRKGKASVDHVHPASSKKAPRLVEIAGIGALE